MSITLPAGDDDDDVVVAQPKPALCSTCFSNSALRKASSARLQRRRW
ncbi:hypothetical protein MY11210_002467 [Beauveria gryllotalpidicola]